MRILMHSHAPWMKTAYGQQTGLFAERFRRMGHDVAISAMSGLMGTTVNWEGVPIYSAASGAYGIDLIPYFYDKWNADLVIILFDAWAGAPHSAALSKLNVANWMPVDAYPLSRLDLTYLIASGASAIAMSKFGERLIRNEGLPASYVPHGVDTEVFTPYVDRTDRDQLRQEVGLTSDTFVIGINAANKDILRKGFLEQFSAFAVFHEKIPDSQLYVHTTVSDPAGIDIAGLTRSCGIEDCVIFPDQGPLRAGEIEARSLVRNFYHMLDLYSGCSLAEGFGVPIIEAQACGMPVVVTDAASMTELCAPGGMLVQGEPLWVEGHQSRWTKPGVKGIAAAYEQMYHTWRDTHSWGDIGSGAREFALQYDADRVTEEYWTPVLAMLGGE